MENLGGGSDITKLVVTQCCNWWCHPIFSSKKWRPLFSQRPLKSDNFFTAIISSPLPPSQPFNIVCPVFSVNSATKKINFIRMSPPAWCHPGRSTPPSDTTGGGFEPVLGRLIRSLWMPILALVLSKWFCFVIWNG